MPPLLLKPHTTYQYRAGDVVYYLAGSQRLLLGGTDITHMRSAPVQLVRATIVTPGQSFAQIAFEQDGHCEFVSPGNLAYRGFCPWCEMPARPDRHRQLVCPSCRQPGVPVPPPDPMVMRWYPGGSGWLTPMIAHRAIVAPTWTYNQALHDSRMALRRTYYGMLQQCGLRRLTGLDYRDENRLVFHAMLEETAAFRHVYTELRQVLLQHPIQVAA